MIDAHLKELLSVAAQRQASLEPTPGLMERVAAGRPPPPGEVTPWFLEYRQEFLRLLGWGEHETLDHPVACECSGKQGGWVTVLIGAKGRQCNQYRQIAL